MQFELIDAYLLGENANKAALIQRLLAEPSPKIAAAGPFYEGLRMLGSRTPDLTLCALRLVLAGKKAEDDAVLALRAASDGARAGGPGAEEARRSYHALLSTDV